MQDSQLIQALKTLDKTEIKEFEKLINSPFFNRGRNFAPFFKELKKFYPEFNSKKLTKEYLYSKLYPENYFNNQVIKNLINGLTRLTEEYLFQINIRNEGTYFIKLANELQARRIYTSAEKILKKACEKINQSKIDNEYFKKMYELRASEREYFLKKNNYKKETESLSELSLYHLYSFISESSILIEDMCILNYNLNVSFSSHPLFKFAGSPEIDRILSYINEKPNEHSEIAELYCLLLNLSVNRTDAESFFKARKLFRKNFEKISLPGKYGIYLELQSIAISLQQIDHDKYIRETFELYKEQIENKAYNPARFQPMDFPFFRDVVNYSLQLKEIKWAENFIKDYIPELLPEYRENMKNYSYARLYFEKGQFDEALNFLSKVKYDNFALKYDIRVLMLRIYYELHYTEEALSLIDTFRHFIAENKSLSQRKRKIQTNFVKYIDELFKLQKTRDKMDLTKLKENIIQSGFITNKEWLLQKIDELLDKNK